MLKIYSVVFKLNPVKLRVHEDFFLFYSIQMYIIVTISIK